MNIDVTSDYYEKKEFPFLGTRLSVTGIRPHNVSTSWLVVGTENWWRPAFVEPDGSLSGDWQRLLENLVNGEEPEV